MAASYYVVQDGEATGPFDLEALAEMVGTGALSAESAVWTTGMDEWQPAEEIAELDRLFTGDDPQTPEEPQESDTAEQPVAARRAAERLPVFATVKTGVMALRRHPLQVAAACLIVTLVPLAASLLLNGAIAAAWGAPMSPGGASSFGAAHLVMLLVVVALQGIMFGGLSVYMIDLVRGGRSSVTRVFAGFRRPISLVVLTFLFWLSLMAGGLLFILPAVFLAVCFMLAPFIVMDAGLSAPAAMGASFRAVMQLGWWRSFSALGIWLLAVLAIGALMMAATVRMATNLGLDQDALSTAARTGQFDANIQIFITAVVSPVQLAVSVVFSALIGATLAAVYERARANQLRTRPTA